MQNYTFPSDFTTISYTFPSDFFKISYTFRHDFSANHYTFPNDFSIFVFEGTQCIASLRLHNNFVRKNPNRQKEILTAAVFSSYKSFPSLTSSSPSAPLLLCLPPSQNQLSDTCGGHSFLFAPTVRLGDILSVEAYPTSG